MPDADCQAWLAYSSPNPLWQSSKQFQLSAGQMPQRVWAGRQASKEPADVLTDMLIPLPMTCIVCPCGHAWTPVAVGQPKQVPLNPSKVEDPGTLMGAAALHQLNKVHALLCHGLDVSICVCGISKCAPHFGDICCVLYEGLSNESYMRRSNRHLGGGAWVIRWQ